MAVAAVGLEAMQIGGPHSTDVRRDEQVAKKPADQYRPSGTGTCRDVGGDPHTRLSLRPVAYETTDLSVASQVRLLHWWLCRGGDEPVGGSGGCSGTA
jgi:hypothetical protein